MRAEEAISQGYAMQIDVLSTDAHIPLKSLLGQPALLQLLTATSRDDLRPFHGHITKVAMNGSNGGFARYTLTIEPWTAFLAHTSDSRIFQDMTVFAIIDAVFEAWQGQGTLAPAWRFDIADEALYPRRSLTTQYHESDRAFIARLLHVEKLFYFFEHTGHAERRGLLLFGQAIGRWRFARVLADHAELRFDRVQTCEQGVNEAILVLMGQSGKIKTGRFRSHSEPCAIATQFTTGLLRRSLGLNSYFYLNQKIGKIIYGDQMKVNN